MSKRRAANELTRDNWDEEEEKVEVGKFQIADESILKNRVLKKAKRTIQRDESGEIKPVFSGFSGFNSLISNTSSKQAFHFLSKCSEIPSESGNHASASTINSVSTSSSLKFSDNNYSKSSLPTIINPVKVMKLNEAFVKFVTDAVQKNPHCVLTPTLKDYEKQISKFVSVASCKTSTSDSSMTSQKDPPQMSSFENTETRIKDADEVKSNSVSIRTSMTSFTEPTANTFNTSNNGFKFGLNNPVSNTKESNNTDLKVNEKIGKNIEKEKSIEPISTAPVDTKNTPLTSEFKFGDFKFNSQPLFSNSLANNSTQFVFGDSKSTSPLSKPPEIKFNPTPSFSFGASSSQFSFKPLGEQSANKLFLGVGSPPLSALTPVSNLNKNDEPQKSKDDDDEDQPPVVNFTPIKENDAIFESKSKLYYLENGKYEEHGVGQLYLKKIDDKKIQLIMRNESALGTIMLNTLLNESVNFTKRGPKNVQLICIVDPSKSTKPQAVLFKFKDAQTTDSFENELSKLKK